MAKDLAQEVFISLYRNRAINNINLEGYLYILLKNRVLDHYRKMHVRENYARQYEPELAASTTDSQINAKEIQAQLAQYLQLLPEQCRKVFVLSREEQLTNREIAGRLGISVNTVEQHMRKALRILRGHMDYRLLVILLLGKGLME